MKRFHMNTHIAMMMIITIMNMKVLNVRSGTPIGTIINQWSIRIRIGRTCIIGMGIEELSNFEI